MGSYPQFRKVVLAVLLSVGAVSAQDSSSTTQSTEEKAAAGDPNAQDEMGMAALARQEYPEALKWYRLAAGQGMAGAQVDLAFMYGNGLGTKQDFVQSAYWAGEAAANGNPDGEYNLGMCYFHGEGVRQDRDLALHWFKKAFTHAPEEDQGEFSNAVGLAMESPPHQDINKDYAEAFHWYLQGAKAGYDLAQFNVCRMTVQGFGVPSDYQEAIKWCSRVAEGGGDSADWGQYGLGIIHEGGLGVPVDIEKAIAWYTKAAESGNAGAQVRLGIVLSAEGPGQRDLVHAYMWVKIAKSFKAPLASGMIHEIAVQMDNSEILEAEKLAAKWIKDHPVDPKKANHISTGDGTYIVNRPR